MILKVFLFTTLFLGLVVLSVTMSIDSDVQPINEMESENFNRERHGPNIVDMRYFCNDADYADVDPEAEEVLSNNEGVGSEVLVVEFKNYGLTHLMSKHVL